VNIGPGDGTCYTLPDNQTITLPLPASKTFIMDGNTGDFELVYYEKPSDNPYTVIAMDLVVIEVHIAGGAWYQVFYWGNLAPPQNSSINGYGPGVDNQLIPKSVLIGPPVAQTGVQIDVDSPLVAAGVTLGSTIDQIRITAPPGGDWDGCDIDAVDTIP
jgi:hypothetical protein